MFRILFSVLFPVSAFVRYWLEFDGDYGQTDLLWGGLVSVILAAAIFAYFAIAVKIERFSAVWNIGVFVVLSFACIGWMILNAEIQPIISRSWGAYMLYFAIWIPIVHVSAKGWHKRLSSKQAAEVEPDAT